MGLLSKETSLLERIKLRLTRAEEARDAGRRQNGVAEKFSHLYERKDIKIMSWQAQYLSKI